jgi:hypothetical protein
MNEMKKEKLNELFFDYICYLIFMSKQILGHRGPYGHFALLKALEKTLEFQVESSEIKNLELFDQIRSEFKTVKGVSSGDLDRWIPFMDKLIALTTKTMKEM